MYRGYETYSFLRLLLPLIAGIVGYLFLGITIPWVVILLLLNFFILFGIAVINKLSISINASFVFGISLNLFLFFTGNYLSSSFDLSNKDDFFAIHKNNSDYLKLKIEEPFVKKGTYYKSTASILASYKNEIANTASGKTYINIKDEEILSLPKYGDVLLLKNKLFEIEGPKNLGEFNYKRYSNLKQIHFQTYLKAGDYTIVCEACGSKLWSNIYQLRGQLVNALIKNIDDETSLAITSALLLGQKNFLTKTVKSTFANTGAMHILAVSGLHVGILFLMLNFLFKPIAHGRWGRALAAILSILIIWIYAGVTGFSASVTRASLMFSLFLVAEIVNRDKNSYNILAASAFLILLYQPNMLAEVGFQLSYAAVFSIVTLYPYIFKWFVFKSKTVNFFWSISAVSIAAQIGTVPISLYYFQQFPTTFLFSNLLAIPAATTIFVSGISILVCSFIAPPLAAFIGKFLEIVIYALHFGLSLLNKLPLSTVEFNSFTSYFPLLMFLFFIGSIIWIINQNRKALWLAALSFLLLCSSNALEKWNSYNEEKLLVYNNKKGLIMETLATGKSIGSISSNGIETSSSYFTKPVNRHFQINEQFNFAYPNVQNLYQIKDKTILLLTKEVNLKDFPKEIGVDVLIIENNPYLSNFEEFINKYKFKEVIITANNNNPKFYLDQFKNHNIKSYSVKEEGMYVANLD